MPRRTGRTVVVRKPRRLMEKRRALGLTLRDVAFLADTPNSYTFIGRLERGERMTCSLELARKWALALRIEEGDFPDFFSSKKSSSAVHDVRSTRARQVA